jgi:hypothetical protein
LSVETKVVATWHEIPKSKMQASNTQILKISFYINAKKSDRVRCSSYTITPYHAKLAK